MQSKPMALAPASLASCEPQNYNHTCLLTPLLSSRTQFLELARYITYSQVHLTTIMTSQSELTSDPFFPDQKKRKVMSPSAAPTTQETPTLLKPTTAPPSTDPSVYDIHHQKFLSDGLPSTSSAWLSRSRLVSEILAADAAARDIDNKSPRAEIALLKSAGLLKVLGPAKYGGGGQSWETAYQVIREVAKGDGSIGMLLGYHLLWSTTADVVGSEEQRERWQREIIENNYFVGGVLRLQVGGCGEWKC